MLRSLPFVGCWFDNNYGSVIFCFGKEDVTEVLPITSRQRHVGPSPLDEYLASFCQ